MKKPKIVITDNRMKWRQKKEFLREYGYQLKFVYNDNWQKIVEIMNVRLKQRQ